MSCEGCEETVEEAIEEVDGVQSVKADRETGKATLKDDVDREAVTKAVEDAGYEVGE